MAIVSIFSGSYCGGDQVIEAVSTRLGYELISTRLLDETSRRFSIPIDKLEKTMDGEVPMLNRLTREREKNAAHLALQLAEMVTADNVIVDGHAAHLVGRGITHALKVCVIANYDHRVKHLMDTSGKSDKEARKAVHRDDQQRLEWTRFLFDKAAYDQTLYDMVIPMHETSVEEAVAMICDNALSAPLATTPGSLRAAEDAVLSARVNLALIEAGHRTEVSSAQGNVTVTIEHDAVNMGQYKDKLSTIASEVDGVKTVDFQISPKFQATSTNPWANIDAPPRVLLVDDEKDFVHTLSERLQTRDFDSSVVYDGEQALQSVDKDEPDVMVLDLMMPGINGLEVLKRVKREHPQVEVIILTGHGSDREETAARELGAFAYLKKPVAIEALSQTMRDAYQKVRDAKVDGDDRSEPED